MVSAHRMLGVAHLFERQNDQAAAGVPQAAAAAPRLPHGRAAGSAAWWSTSSTACCKRAGGRAGRARAQAARRPTEDERRRRGRRAGRAHRRRAALRSATRCAVSFVPFGAGQFQNGQRTQGLGLPGQRDGPGARSRWGRCATNFALYGVRPSALRCEHAGGGGGRATAPRDQGLAGAGPLRSC